MEKSSSSPDTEPQRNVRDITMASILTHFEPNLDTHSFQTTQDGQSTWHKNKPPIHSQTQCMEIDAQPTSSQKFHVQSLFQPEPHFRKRSGFDRVRELEEELVTKDQKLRSLAADATIKSSEIIHLGNQVQCLKANIEELQDNITAQKQLNDGAWASAKKQDIINQKLCQTNTDLTRQLYDQGKMPKVWASQSSGEEDIEGNAGFDSEREKLKQMIKKLESECHELKVQIGSLQESSQELSRVNKELEGLKELYNDLREQSQEQELTQLNESLTSSIARCEELEKNTTDLRNEIILLAEEKQVLQHSLVSDASQISDYKMACANLRRKLADSEENAKTMETKLSKQIDELLTKNSLLTTTKSELFSELEEMQTAIEEKAEQYENDLNDLNQTKKDLEVSEENNQQLLNDYELLKENYTDLQHQKDKELELLQKALGIQDTRLSAKQEDNQRLADEIANLKQDRAELDVTINELRYQSETSTKGIEALGNKFREKDEHQRSTADALESTKMDRDSLQNMNDSLNAQLSAAHKSYRQVNEEKEKLSEDLERKCRELRVEINDSQTRYNMLETQLQEASTRNSDVAAKLAKQVEQDKTKASEESIKQHQELQDRINDLKTTNDSLAAQLKQAHSDSSAVTNNLFTLQEQSRLASEEKQKLSQELEQNQNGIRKLKDDYTALDTELQLARTQNLTVVNELASAQKTSERLLRDNEQSFQQRMRELESTIDELKTQNEQLTAMKTLFQESEQHHQKLQDEIKNLKSHNNEHWVARARFDLMQSKYDNLETKHEGTMLDLVAFEKKLAEKENELKLRRTNFELNTTAQAESQDLKWQVSEKLKEIASLQRDKSSLEAVVRTLKAELTTASADIGIPDQIAVLQQENLQKSLTIQRLERQLQASASSHPFPIATSSNTSSTHVMAFSQPSQHISPSHQSAYAKPLSHLTAVPMNGDIVHDIRAAGGLGATLARAPVQRELNRVRANYPHWGLPKTFLDSGNYMKPWTKPKPSPYVQPKRKETKYAYLEDEPNQDEDSEERAGSTETSGSNYTPGLSSQGKGKQKQAENLERRPATPVNVLGSDDEDEDEDEHIEPLDDENAEPSDISRVQARWENSSSKRLSVKNCINELARDLLREGFNVRNIWAIFARDGIPLKTIEDFIKDPHVNAPKLRNTRLDKFAADPKSMKASPWNRALAHRFAEKAAEIAANSNDGRFGPHPIDWDKLFSDRLYRVYKQIVEARPLPGESKEARVLRLVLAQNERNKRSANRSLLHIKRSSRSEVATVMLKVCRERNDEAGIQFWSYALGVLEILGDPGMSDEEDSSVEVEVEGVVVKQSVKKVKRSYWRAPQVEDLCRVMDTAPALEILIFHKAGAKRVPRIRTDHLSHRLPGPGLPRDFYRKEFLDSLMPHEVADLRFADYSFKLFDLAGYDPSMPDNDNRRMEVD